MALDGITIANTAFELNSLLTGARISRIAQPENNELSITSGFTCKITPQWRCL